MNEDSDGMNESDNNNSEVVILPERSHVDELLLSDNSDSREDPSEYERKLDEKLKDLGLWEDDMTINQKEELLAVVVISCETAEQEENKRQLIKDYLEGTQNLPDEIEFSLQESAWLADEANLLCSATVTSKDDSPDQSKLASFANFGPSTSTEDFEAYESVSQTERSFRSSPEIFEDATAYSELFMDSQSSTSENDTKSHEQEQDSDNKVNAVKIAVTHPILHSKRLRSGDIYDKQVPDYVENVFLEDIMSNWRPCMSPKSKTLKKFKCNNKSPKNIHTSFAMKQKINRYQNSFDEIALCLNEKLSPSSRPVPINKPYVLLHHGSLARKACKLDTYDDIIGVTEEVDNEETDDNFNPSTNTLTRTKSAFHRVKPSSHGRHTSFPDSNPEAKTTRSGATYGSQKLLQFSQEKIEPADVVLDDLFNNTFDAFDVDGVTLNEKQVTFIDSTITNDSNKLPNFCDIRPEILNSTNMIIPSPVFKEENSATVNDIQSNCVDHNNSSAKLSLKEQKIGNTSEKGYSSDSSSSLIDVETIVDDEIEDFVMKRKFTPNIHKASYSKNLSHSKKLRKNES